MTIEQIMTKEQKYRDKLPPRKDCELLFQYLSAWRFKGGVPKEKIMQDIVIKYEC